MACADGRLTRRPGVLMVSRGPGASNASIAIHTAQQDAIPLILVIGQVCKKDLRREAFQEIDYQKMFGTIAKWVVEPTDAWVNFFTRSSPEALPSDDSSASDSSFWMMMNVRVTFWPFGAAVTVRNDSKGTFSNPKPMPGAVRTT